MSELDDSNTLRYYELNPGVTHKIRPEDEEARRAVMQPQTDFLQIVAAGNPTQQDILTFLDNMSKFCHNKAV